MKKNRKQDELRSLEYFSRALGNYFSFVPNYEDRSSQDKKSLLKKLKAVYKQGYLPARKDQPYTWIRQSDFVHVETIFNCFAHACFNITNEIIVKQDFTVEECAFFQFTMPFSNHKKFESSITKFIRKAGLKIKKCQPQQKLKPNQWKVAVMFAEEDCDFHFLLEEKDGTWSGKCGCTEKIQKFPSLPEVVREDILEYRLYQTYSITNPHAKTSKNEKQKAD